MLIINLINSIYKLLLDGVQLEEATEITDTGLSVSINAINSLNFTLPRYGFVVLCCVVLCRVMAITPNTQNEVNRCAMM